MDNLREKTVSALIYKLIERGSAQFFSFIVQIILARIIMPEDFGAFALFSVLLAILNVSITYGYANSLIVNRDSDNVDFSTSFFFGIFLSCVVFLLICYFSNDISYVLYDDYEKSLLVIVMSLRLPLSAINTIQISYVAKQLQFKYILYSTLGGAIFSGIIGIVVACCGYGIWALVIHNLSSLLVAAVIMWFLSDWKPQLLFSFSRLRIIYNYGWKIMAVGLIDTSYAQVRSFILAKGYSSSSLAYYNRGMSFPGYGLGLIETTIGSVLFPALSSCNNDVERMRSLTKRAVKCSTYVLTCLLSMLAAISAPLIIVLLTDKWKESIIFLQIGCFAYLFRPIQIINSCVVRASGKSGLLLKLDIIKKAIGFALLFSSMKFGVEAIAWSFAATNIISCLINLVPNKRLLHYGCWEQSMDFISNLSVGIIVGLLVWFLNFMIENVYLLLFVQLISGLILIIFLSKLMGLESYRDISDIISKSIVRRFL